MRHETGEKLEFFLIGTERQNYDNTQIAEDFLNKKNKCTRLPKKLISG